MMNQYNLLIIVSRNTGSYDGGCAIHSTLIEYLTKTDANKAYEGLVHSLEEGQNKRPYSIEVLKMY